MADTQESTQNDNEVRFEIDAQAVAWITLDRPDVLNALTVDNRKRLTALFIELSTSDDTRAVVLTGAGRGFCSGADLRSSRGTNGPPPEPLEAEAFYQAANARTEDAREGLMSFVERRAPSFKGR